jgi:hypothetical protein
MLNSEAERDVGGVDYLLRICEKLVAINHGKVLEVNLR